MGPYTNPTVQDFKDYFNRDFPYGTTSDTVMDSDIVKAETLASIYINQCLFPDQGTYTIGFLYLSAHFLVMNLRASSQGIAGKYPWLQTGKSVGSVSESFAIPERIEGNPEYAMFYQTNYGAQFMFLILPQLSGNIVAVWGGTNP